MSNTEEKAPDDDLQEEIQTSGDDRSEDNPNITMEAFRAAGLGVLTDDEIDDLIACVHEWRHEWVHKSEL